MRKTAPARDQAEDYRRDLVAKRRDFLSGLETKFDTLARLGRVAEDDQAPISHDEFVSVHLNSLDYAQLRLVEEALVRLDSGQFGTCLHCERPIPAKRLRALPWARYCVECQETMSQELESAWEKPERRTANSPLRG